MDARAANVISKKCRIYGAKNIVLQGSTLIEDNVVLRGDKASKPIMSFGRWCVLREGCTLEPPVRGAACPQKIGTSVYIGRGATIKSAQIGSWCIIGDGCELGEFSIVRDCSVLPPGTKLPRYAVWDDELPESAREAIDLYCRRSYAGIECHQPFAGERRGLPSVQPPPQPGQPAPSPGLS